MLPLGFILFFSIIVFGDLVFCDCCVVYCLSVLFTLLLLDIVFFFPRIGTVVDVVEDKEIIFYY